MTYLLLLIGLTVQAAPLKWVSIAKEMSEAPDQESEATIWANSARADSVEEAEAEALRICRKYSGNPKKCHIHKSVNQYCIYISFGDVPWLRGRVGWATAETPQKAYDRCHAQKLNCYTPSGGCANPEEDMSKDIVEAPRIPYWGALAVGTGRDYVQSYVGVGTGSEETKDAAEARAVKKCNENFPDGDILCRAVGAFNTGCGYIARGFENPSGGDLSWGTGPTAQEAYDRCRRTGNVCRTDTSGFCIR